MGWGRYYWLFKGDPNLEDSPCRIRWFLVLVWGLFRYPTSKVRGISECLSSSSSQRFRVSGFCGFGLGV